MRPTPPEGYHTVTPRMVVREAEEATRFLRAVFGATGEVVPGRPAELRLGDSMVLVSGSGEREVFPAFLYIYVVDVEATYQRALVEGAASLEAPTDTPYGDRRAMVRDESGNVFQIARRLDAAN